MSRTSCELQVLDSAIVEKIEEAVEKAKVTEAHTAYTCCSYQRFPLYILHFCLTLFLFLGEEEHQESACDSQASSPLQSEYCVCVCIISVGKGICVYCYISLCNAVKLHISLFCCEYVICVLLAHFMASKSDGIHQTRPHTFNLYKR